MASECCSRQGFHIWIELQTLCVLLTKQLSSITIVQGQSEQSNQTQDLVAFGLRLLKEGWRQGPVAWLTLDCFVHGHAVGFTVSRFHYQYATRCKCKMCPVLRASNMALNLVQSVLKCVHYTRTDTPSEIAPGTWAKRRSMQPCSAAGWSAWCVNPLRLSVVCEGPSPQPQLSL